MPSDETEEYTEDQLAQLYEAAADEVETARLESPVTAQVTHATFLSKSKGWRNGKRRLRRGVEVDLITYAGRTHSAHKFPYDKYASEIYEHRSEGEAERLYNDIHNKNLATRK